MKTFTLSHATARASAIRFVTEAPDGYHVIIKEPKRSTAQNDLMWDLLTDVSHQQQWHGQWLVAEDWKLLFLNALNSEMRTVPALDNRGFVNLGRSSSKLSKAQMSDLIEVIYAFGAQHGVAFHNEKAKDV